jgi:hypothetical protein
MISLWIVLEVCLIMVEVIVRLDLSSRELIMVKEAIHDVH